MSRGPSGSSNHRIWKLHADEYRLSWTVARKYGRLLYPRRYTKDTNLAGAQRFAKKWNLPMPVEA